MIAKNALTKKNLMLKSLSLSLLYYTDTAYLQLILYKYEKLKCCDVYISHEKVIPKLPLGKIHKYMYLMICTSAKGKCHYKPVGNKQQRKQLCVSAFA